MNKLLFSEGGQPLYLDDLNYLQNSLADSIKGLASPFGDVVLSGCVISSADNKTSWTTGYLVILGEIYKVEAGSINKSAPPALYWKVVRTNEQLETFEDNSENYIYQTGKATLVESIVESDVYVDAKTIRTMDSYLTTYKKKEIEFVPTLENTEGSITLYENNQGFHIVKIDFHVKSKISFVAKPIFAYRCKDLADYGILSGRFIICGSSAPLIFPFVVTNNGSAILYNSESVATLTLDGGFYFSITYTKISI